MPKGRSNKRYTLEFKRTVVETMREEHLSIREVMRRFEINNHGIIERWERIYLEEGPEGLAIERRGRKNSSRSAKSSKTVEEDLIAENQRLRAENEYLKNLQALVLEEERRQRRKRRQSRNLSLIHIFPLHIINGLTNHLGRNNHAHAVKQGIQRTLNHQKRHHNGHIFHKMCIRDRPLSL